MKSILLFWGFACSIQAYDFGNMQSITAYTQQMPEFLHNDPNTSFTTFNQSHAVSYIDRLLHLFGLRTIVDIDDFITTMHQVTEQRELNGCFGSFIEKHYIAGATHWFICGALHGAVHAQVSLLDYLQKQRIINDQLELIQADTYLIFTDNMQAYTPYGIESFWIMLKLMAKNSGKVMLLKTTDWPLDAWQDTAMVDAFYDRFNRPKLLLKRLLDAFVNTLPEAIYLMSDDGNVIKITAGIKLDDVSWNTFFKEKVSGIFHTKYITPSGGATQFKGVLNIHDQLQKDKRYEPRLTHTHGIWSLIAQQDAFVCIGTEKYFDHWNLQLFEQSQHDRNDFKLVRSYNLLSGLLSYSADVTEHIKQLEQQVAAAQQEVEAARKACGVSDDEK